jgi:dynactin 1
LIQTNNACVYLSPDNSSFPNDFELLLLFKRQRKREEDFQRTVSNYRKSVETLKQEKNALYELHQGGEGEKSDLASASQKALARAAQLVQDAAEMRKREAQAAIDRIDSQVRLHLSNRLESMLPASVATAEIASIKGELLLSKVVGKSSLSLDGIARSFAKTIRAKSWEWRSNKSNSEEKEEENIIEQITLALTDEQQQMAATMIHQSEVAHVAIDVSGDLLWLLSAGQWPDILSTEASSELGAIMGHSMSELDIVLGNVLNTLKEEGVLSPHQSNIGAFRQTVVTTMQTLRSHIEQDGESLVPMDWKPAALRLFRDASRAKYSSLGCYAAVACILNAGNAIKSNEEKMKSQEFIEILRPLLKKLDQAASEAAKSCLRLAKLDVLDETIVSSLSEAAEIWRTSSDDLLGNVYNMLLSEDGLSPEAVGACEAATDEVVRVVSHFATVLRSANLTDADDHKFHPFSPEIADVWEGVTMLARTIRSKDGDEDDVNYLVRARTIENSLEDAVESVPELSLAKTKVFSLEKSLALRSKEISMQNARLSDLEKMLARSNAQPSSRLVASQASSEEVKSLKQENRYLSEAMDVLHRQVEEYENEIRARDSKTPTKARRPRRSYTPESTSRSSSQDSMRDGEDGSRSAFEAALFRPALQAARRDAAQWKTKATVTALMKLPPLKVSMEPTSLGGGEEKFSEEDMDPLFQLSSSLSSYQRETASVRLVDITKSTKSPRMQLHDMMMRKAAASQEVDKAAAVARQWLESHRAGIPKIETATNPLVGRVKFAGPEPIRRIPTPATGEDLYRIQLNLVK